MLSRHAVDVSIKFDRSASQPATKLVEVADVDPIPPTSPPLQVVSREPYITAPDLEDSVNLAIALGRPLLVQGDPGAGKTRLAYAVAFALGLPLESVYIKSTSRAQDLLYTYDAVRRLYDAQLPSELALRRDIRSYVALGPLGRAIARAEAGRRSVVLIDEIDKADIDFPNDLLRELDLLEFDVPDVPDLRHAVPTDRPDLRPVIIVTHNEEKALPPAFLRRCIYHFVSFPEDPVFLDEILELHAVHDPTLRSNASRVLLELRSLDLIKKPGLSELLDWASYLQTRRAQADRLADLPHLGALLKHRSDVLRARRESS